MRSGYCWGPILLAVLGGCQAGHTPGLSRGCIRQQGGIVRGPTDRKQLALVFTGGEFADGAGPILDTLQQRGVRASFFLTGDFLRDRANESYLNRMIIGGHYVGPHSDAHPLYCSWEDRSRTLLSRQEFQRDLQRNLTALARQGISHGQMLYFMPPYEWYNQQIADWTAELGLILVNFTPGTRSNADYMPDSHPRFISSPAIVESILDYESAHADGLNGFILLLHLGSGPGRTDKMHPHVGPLIDELTARGYQLVRIDQLLESDR